MGGGSLPPQRPDQRSRPTPRTTAPGARVLKVEPVTPGNITAFSTSIGSGNTAVFFTGAQNPNGILVGSMSMNNMVVAGPSDVSASFTSQDAIVDDNGGVYLGCEAGCPPGVAVAVPNSTEIDYGSIGGVVIPAGIGLSLVNGGSGGSTALHRVTGNIAATVVM